MLSWPIEPLATLMRSGMSRKERWISVQETDSIARAIERDLVLGVERNFRLNVAVPSERLKEKKCFRTFRDDEHSKETNSP